MTSKPNTKEKSSVAREKNISKENSEQMVLVREEISQVLMIIDSNKVSLINKTSKLIPGITVVWQGKSRERWRGPILAIGTEEHCLQVMDTIQKNLQDTNNDSVELKNKDKQNLQSTITIEPKTSEDKQSDEDGCEQSILHVVEAEENERDASLLTTTDNSIISPSSISNKRPPEENDNISSKRKKNSHHGISVPYAVYSAKEKECLLLKAQVNQYEQEWMPRPKDPRVIQYLIEITNILTGNVNDTQEDLGDVLLEIMEVLNMSEEQLARCHGRTATATARHIMKFKYPNPSPNFKFSKIDDNILQTII
ncbi:unnamed protein product, partial [Rotaria sordida]